MLRTKISHIDKLRSFVDWIMEQSAEFSDVDSGEIVDKLEALKLVELRDIPRHESIDGEEQHYFTIWTHKT